MTAMPPRGPLSPGARLAVRPLSVVAEGEEFVVGDAQAGVFLAVPELGLVALRALEEGKTLAEAGAAVSAYAGEDVDVLAFAETLLDAGLVTPLEETAVAQQGSSSEQGAKPRRRPIAGAFLSAPAWTLYGLMLAASATVFVAKPEYLPSYEDLFFYPNPAVCLALGALTGLTLAAAHELCHWLAARHAGVGARIRISRRLFFPVFETDLTQLFSVPRRRRYAPLLAGMAFDTVVLTVSLGLRLAWHEAWLDLPPLLARFLGLLVLLSMVGLGFQILLFLRTDLYAVATTALGCRNLYRVNHLYLKVKLRPLSRTELAELCEAHPRDLQVARWFSLAYAVGLAWAAWYFVQFFLPTTVLLAGWMFHSLSGAPLRSSAFWEAAAIGALAAAEALWPLLIYARERLEPRSATAP